MSPAVRLGRFLKAAQWRRKYHEARICSLKSLDRISRQEIRKSLSLFLQIIEAGINIVTLTDRRVFNQEKCELEDLMMSLLVMSRAHEESLTKSRRVGAAWANKRAKSRRQALTARCPAWLKLSNDGTRYEMIEKRAAVIRRIFDDSASGIGNYSITQRLNKQLCPISVSQMDGTSVRDKDNQEPSSDRRVSAPQAGRRQADSRLATRFQNTFLQSSTKRFFISAARQAVAAS